MTPRYAHLLALVALGMLVASGQAFAQTDYDTDNDNLIDVTSLAQLNAIRYDLNGDGTVAAGDTVAYNDAFPYAASGMGCQATCTGYELMNNLDFDTDGSGSVGTGDTYPNWDPIVDPGNDNNGYTAIFEGNGHTISRLTISNRTSRDVGLFDELEPTGIIRNVGIIDANIQGGGASDGYAPLVGYNARGTIIASYARGGSVTATGIRSSIGGLTGRNSGVILASYSTVTVIGGGHTRVNAGGLTGTLESSGTTGRITASYAVGAVSATGNNATRGGLVGSSASNANVIASSYCTSGSCIGSNVGGSLDATTQTATALQTPTGYTGIYSAWNVNIDSNAGNDDPWDFGTSSQYPVLKYGGHSLLAQGRPPTDYDLDNDRLIDITTLAQLNAIRHDLNGNGDATHADYGAAFPDRNTTSSGRMGCPSGTCTGYELLSNLDFDENGDGAITQADATYWNSGAGWDPIGSSNTAPYTATFEGNGKTISHLYINRYINYSGFFASTDTTAHIRSLGLVNAVINTGQGTVGALVGLNKGRIAASYVTGSVTANTNVGGLVGATQRGSYIVASYATAPVVCNQSGPWATGGGLVGANGSGATIASSYSTGSVTGACLHKHGLAENSGTVTDSYWDTQTSGIADDSDTVAPEGKLTADLQSVTSASGIYANWDDLTIDASGANNDDPWTFGTTKQYPALTFAGLDTTAQFATQPVHYDTDSDGLLEVSTLAQLHAMRWDLNGDGVVADSDAMTYNAAFPNGNLSASKGCPSTGCIGYELLNNLDFDENNDGAITQADATYWNGGAGWDPVGSYGGTFKGNNKTISHLFINRGSRHNTGLFHAVDGDVSGLGLLNVDVTGADRVGGLAGNQGGGGTISSCYVTGRVSGAKWGVGGLVGRSYRTSGTNRIVSSYARVSVRVPASVTSDGMAGGLVGWLTDQTEVVASYALGSVFAGHSSAVGGGLVGSLASGGDVTASYATGAVTGAGTKGGLVGSSAGTVTDSYWDTQESGIADDSDTVAPEGKLTSDLQSVTSASGIYANWDDLTIDASGTNDDDPWTFGTTKQYPVLTFAGLDTTAQFATQPVHYDTDSDGLLEVSTLAQLHAMRWDLDGNGFIDASASTSDTTAYNAAFPNGNLSASKGCPSSGCIGYELLNNLDFDENNDGAITQADATYWNGGAGWYPVGPYGGTFKGNNKTISHLFINRGSRHNTGLFHAVDGDVSGLGLLNVNVTGADRVGGLAGNQGGGGTISSCYVTGRVSGSRWGVGGLVGRSFRTSGTNRIVSSYALVSVRVPAHVTSGGMAGGLVGWLTDQTEVVASYALGSVFAGHSSAVGGGLVGSLASGGGVTASYATGAVTGAGTKGGLVGSSAGTVTDSYWDTQTSDIADDSDTVAPEGKLTADLQSVTSASGIYANWDDLTIDASGANNDDPWTFGTTNQYPALKFAGLDTTAQFATQPVHYDTDSDGLLEVSTLAQLHAMRWDLNGDGVVADSDAMTYNAAFPNGNLSASKGCPSTGCIGYELLNNLDFDENNDGAITQADATYWNGGAGWNPVGSYGGTFKGNNKTISHLFIDRGSRHNTGLFHAVDGDVSGLGLLNVNVTGADRVGGLAGNQGGGGTISSCYVTGRVSGSRWGVGGLVGRSYRTSGTNRIVSSYALVSVRVPAHVTSDGLAGGLVGWLTDQTEVVASYALGSVFAGHSSAVGGGLVGQIASGGSVTASYAIGRVTGAGTKGGLVGSSAGTVTDSHWDTSTSGQTSSAGGSGVVGKTTSDLLSPTTYGATSSDTYYNWNANIDGQPGNDDPWTFGAMDQYPALKYAGMDTTVQFQFQPARVTLALTPSSISESGGISTVTATLAHPLSAATTITVRPVAGAYTVGADSTITIAAGSTANASDTVVITAVNNTRDEPNRNVTVSGVAGNAQVAGSVTGATLTLEDDDPAPTATLAASPASISENSAVSTITASLSRPSSAATTITVRPVAGAYTVGADTTITIAAGDTINASDTVVITTLDNTRDELARTVTISGVSRNAQGAGSVTGTVTLTDDDAAPDVTMVLSDGSITENGGISTVTARLSHTSSDPTTITVTVAPVSPAVMTDYTISTPATLTVAAGQTMSTGTVTITGVNNADATGNKTVTVSSTLTNSVGTGSVTDVTLTLTDDDVPNVTLVLSPASITENAQVSTITATLDRVATVATTVTVSATAVAPAVAGDFTLSTTTTLTFAANVTTSTGSVTITSVNDTTDAPDKGVTVSATVAGGNGASLSSAVTLTITDDEAAPTVTLSLSPASIAETGGVSTITATLSHRSSAATTITVRPVTGTYTVGMDSTITIVAGSTANASDTVEITAVDNATDAPNNSLTVSVAVSNDQGAGSVTGTDLTITDDDAAPDVTLTLMPASISEAGGVSTVSATLTHPSSEATTITVRPVANAYTVGSDSTITIAAGSTANATDTVALTAVDNDIDASDNAVMVQTAAVENDHGAGTVQAVTLTITDDDEAAIEVSAMTTTTVRLHTTESGRAETFTVTLASEPTGNVALSVVSSDTTEGTVSPSVLTFSSTTWSTAQTVTVTGQDDAPANSVDGNQNYTVTLSVNQTDTQDANYDALSPVSVYMINRDNDFGLDISALTGQATEAGGSATFTVALLTQPTAAVTISVTSQDPSEGRVEPAMLTFAPASYNTAQTVTVTGQDDTIDDGNVLWTVRLASSSGDTNYNNLSDEDVPVTTTDDEDVPTVTLVLTPSSISENGEVSTITATLSHPSSAITTITVSATPVSPATASDFTLSGADTLIIAATTTTSTGTVTITAVDNDDRADEKTVSVSATANNAQGITAPSPVTLTLTDDETPECQLGYRWQWPGGPVHGYNHDHSIRPLLPGRIPHLPCPLCRSHAYDPSRHYRLHRHVVRAENSRCG